MRGGSQCGDRRVRREGGEWHDSGMAWRRLWWRVSSPRPSGRAHLVTPHGALPDGRATDTPPRLFPRHPTALGLHRHAVTLSCSLAFSPSSPHALFPAILPTRWIVRLRSSKRRSKRIWEIATSRFGLDPFPTHFEIVPATVMYEVGSYALPGRYSHWSFGKAYHRLKTMYDFGLSKSL